ncbi:MAG: glycoside hydrolase family 32 protein [Bacillaceae bacterium]|nr:glycoside hydrolase family 32 protein [Bacillaceae bacterium]
MNRLKPVYHFMAPVGWMNDPNGPIYLEGAYHLFYQYNPHGDHWDTIHWGHARSRDMVFWEHLPIALAPSLEKGEHHCFSGCTVVDDEGKPIIFYTSVGEGERNQITGAEQWMATGSSDLISWKKWSGNPVMTPDIHGDMAVTEWRDPFVWKEKDSWYMLLGGSYQGAGCVLIYRSPDLVNWEFLNRVDEDREGAGVWECPGLFTLQDKHVLLYSPDQTDDYRVRYKIGTLRDDFRFESEYEGILDHGGKEGFYAPTTFLDGQGRRVMFGWMPETRGDFEGIKGWAGVQAIPRILSLQNDRLCVEPIPEISKLREEEYRFEEQAVTGSMDTGIRGKALELQLVVRQSAGRFWLKVFRSPGGEEETVLWIDPENGSVVLDRSRSSLYPGISNTAINADLDPAMDGVYHIRVLLDHSSIEVFVNHGTCLSTRVYPQREDSMQVHIGSEKILQIEAFRGWKLKAIR